MTFCHKLETVVNHFFAEVFHPKKLLTEVFSLFSCLFVVGWWETPRILTTSLRVDLWFFFLHIPSWQNTVAYIMSTFWVPPKWAWKRREREEERKSVLTMTSYTLQTPPLVAHTSRLGKKNNWKLVITMTSYTLQTQPRPAHASCLEQYTISSVFYMDYI